MDTPIELASIISYGLEQLRVQNRHHDFEHLCRHLTKARIVSNVLPATGPVAGSGDQGRDFETFHTYLASGLKYSKGFLGLAASEPIAFACTTQSSGVIQKIKSDVDSICTQGAPVSRVYVFCVEPVKISERHAMADWVNRNYGINLEIIDGQAISEILSDHEVIWIAQKFLHLPSGLIPESSIGADEPEVGADNTAFDKRERRKSIRLADSELGRAIDLIAASSGKSLQDVGGREFMIAVSADLRALHRISGSPDLDFISAKSGYEVQKIALFFSGKNRPSGAQIGGIVSAIAEYALESGIDIPASMLDMVAWRRKLRVARKSGMQKIVKNKARGKLPPPSESSGGANSVPT